MLAAYAVAIAFAAGPLWIRIADSLKIFPSAFPGWDLDQAWQYNTARYVAAAVFLYGSIRILYVLFADRLADARASTRRGHVVICGVDEVGRRCADAMLAEGFRVTGLEVDKAAVNAQAARAHGALVLTHDATDPSVLERARVHRAKHVICAGPDDETNTRIAAQVALITQSHRAWVGPSVHVRMADRTLLDVLRGPLGVLGATRLHFFNCDDLWGRLLLDQAEVTHKGQGMGLDKIAVFGSTSLARALVVEAAHRTHQASRAGKSGPRKVIRLACEDAPIVVADLANRYPRISVFTDLEPIANPPSNSELEKVLDGVTVAFVALQDPSATLSQALAIDRILAGSAPVFVAQTAGVTDLGVFLSDVTDVVPVPLPAHITTDLLHDYAGDAIARALHAAYLNERRAATDFGTRPADQPWSQLPAHWRVANHQHADAMVDHLRSVWLETDTCDDWDEHPMQLSEATIDVLAQLEHERWRHTMRLAGWTVAPSRDDAHKRHDLLVDWNELTNSAKEVTRALVRGWPALLGQAGLRIQTSPCKERLARELHNRYATEHRDEAHQAPPTWDELTDEAREWNRASVQHIAVKLAAVGCRIVPHTLGDTALTRFTSREIDTMARLEHERWCAERRASGWTVGARNDRARIHPSLVTWEVLPESERNKDRAIVREIPELLRMVGQIVVRS